MDADFWHRKWANDDIGFHEGAVNPLLVRHLPALSLAEGARVFLPLCGKTLDIHWLLGNGYRVAGAELSRLAVEQLFAELGTEPTVSRFGQIEHHGAPGLDIFVGDIFAVSARLLGAVDAIYDRAALVALPEDMRRRYTAHLTEITADAPQLLICFEYDQSLLAGPPFAIAGEEIARHYRSDYEVTLLDRVEIPGGFKGKLPAQEAIWLLKRRAEGKRGRSRPRRSRPTPLIATPSGNRPPRPTAGPHQASRTVDARKMPVFRRSTAISRHRRAPRVVATP